MRRMAGASQIGARAVPTQHRPRRRPVKRREHGRLPIDRRTPRPYAERRTENRAAGPGGRKAGSPDAAGAHAQHPGRVAAAGDLRRAVADRDGDRVRPDLLLRSAADAVLAELRVRHHRRLRQHSAAPGQGRRRGAAGAGAVLGGDPGDPDLWRHLRADAVRAVPVRPGAGPPVPGVPHPGVRRPADLGGHRQAAQADLSEKRPRLRQAAVLDLRRRLLRALRAADHPERQRPRRRRPAASTTTPARSASARRARRTR